MVLLRQLFDPQSSTCTYLVACPDTRQAVLIDPVFHQARRDQALVRELGLELHATLETHVHADHITGAWLLKQSLGSRIMLARAGDAEGADRLLEHGDMVAFGRCSLDVRATPGHTAGCLTFVLGDRSAAFTGDCLLVRGCGRVDFQGGDAATLYRSVHEQIFTLPNACLVWPGHDYRGLTVSSVGEERRYNPRLGGDLSCGDFRGCMDNLDLPRPREMEVNVAANLRCGRPDGAGLVEEHPEWAPLDLSFGGVWEIAPEWVAEHLHEVRVLDVREEHEFRGPLGHVPGATLIPLGDLANRMAELDRETPLVAVCRAGGRSAQAVNLLRKAGFRKLANLPGGMLRWRTEGLPTAPARTAP